MKALVIYDTKYGNTRKIAEVIAKVLSEHGKVKTISVEEAAPTDLVDTDLLAIGGPTQAHGLSPAIRTFLQNVPDGMFDGILAITFDTRYNIPGFLTGSAAGQIEKTLRKMGYKILLPHESFFITGKEGPLADGELERAANWTSLALGKLNPAVVVTGSV